MAESEQVQSGRDQEEYVVEDGEAKRLANHVKQAGVIDDWIICKVIGAGANGLVASVTNRKTNEKAVMKIAMNLSTSGSLYWESDVLERIMQPSNNEDRTRHLVRRVDCGHTVNMDKQDVGYIVMENLPGNPVGILGALSGNALISKVAEFGLQLLKVGYIVMENLPGNPVGILGALSGNALISKVAEFGLQLLKALYDLHYLGFVHRDIKPENVGLYRDEILVLYDLGMSRFYTNKEGRVREPRCHIGMRGTDEWASLNAELGRDQGRVDDLWGWFYVLIEWVNCASKYPLCWAPFEDDPDMRHFCKSGLFPAKFVLRNCPSEFFKIQCYLRCLGRDDSPDYLYLARLLLQAKQRADGTAIPASSSSVEEDDEKWDERMALLEMEYY
ncbi:putative serine/threonine-protein kinase [Toxocara canis]|uniref:Putative serine/threonine-protein kinase n=1 Tax=Toxocara canis TaxID=6265 RepID=A0A0B2VKM2_TOXCA|nr:putative serine/threonine-protein kinase [Toxocara canis]